MGELEYAVVLQHVVAFVDLFHDGPVGDQTRLDVPAMDLRPALGDAVRSAPEGFGVDGPVGAEHADHHRAGIAPAELIGDILEQEGGTLLGRQAAELQPHQRHELGVLADRSRDAAQQAVRL